MQRFCLAWNRVYIKANSRVPCWCDTGEKHTIVQKDVVKHDFIREIVNGPEMREMRLTIIEKQKDYVKYCQKCCMMISSNRNIHFRHITQTPEDLTPQLDQAKNHLTRVQKRRGWEYGSLDRIQEIQVEPTFPCNLRCPGCLHGIAKNPLERETPPYILPLESFKRMIDSILYNEVTIERMTFVGRGEPTLNKEFPAMLEYGRSSLPNTLFTTDTNSNQPYHQNYDHLSWINCSIDGSTPESYGTYRRGGNFEKAITFMRDAAKHRKSSKIRWKYILFDTTDAEHLLLQALRMSRDLDIDQIRFIITSVGAKDKSVMPSSKTLAEMEQFLASQTIFSNAVVEYST